MNKFYAKTAWLIFILLPLTCLSVFSQTIGIGTTSPNTSAALDISNTAKGLLIPRMASAGITAISNPAKGLMVYDSVKNQLLVNMGTALKPNWQNIVANSGWALSGNSGTGSISSFVGTTDAAPLVFKVNSQSAGQIGGDYENTSLGYLSMSANPTGANNAAFGFFALSLNTTGDDNTANGCRALFYNTNGYNNTASGSQSLYSNTLGYGNTANGVRALYSNTSGSVNTAIGQGSLYSNTSGGGNTALGGQAMYNNTAGEGNTAVGTGTLAGTTASWYNTAIGYLSGERYDLGYNNTLLGANCNGSFAGQYNIIAIGQDVTCTDNSQARIGNAATSSIGGYANWTNISDGRYKKNLKENVQGLAFIMKLRPVTYNLDITGLSNKLNESRGKPMDAKMKTAIAEKEQVVQTGFVAQEVEQAAKETSYEFSGVDKPRTAAGLYGLRYAEFVVPLVKAVQEQQAIIKEMQQQINELKALLKK